MSGHDVRVVYTKYDGSLHWHQTMHYLGEDGHGIWLGAHAGAISQRGDEPPIAKEHPYVMLFPRDAWWTAVFNGEPARTEVYCDITTPAQWPDPAEVTMIDLDLDVLRRRCDQRVVLVDEDEFAEHQVRYRYPADVIRQAQQSAAWLLDAITGGVQPFAGEYLAWLGKVR